MRKDLPSYKSHKVVQAFKIESVTRFGATEMYSEGEGHGEPERFFVEGEGHRVEVKQDFIGRSMRAMDEMVGGYYVRYPNEFEAWSPADAFEDGYTAVN